MVTEEDLKKFFGELEIPEKLFALRKFDEEVAQGYWFSEGFEFSLDKDRVGLKTYSDDTEFLNSLYEFANADGNGSSYGFWLCDGNVDLNKAPIVAFGSEGGFHIVAKDLSGLLEILTFDSEPMIDWDEIYYYKDPDDFEPSPKSEEYCSWLKEKYEIGKIDNADNLVKEAQKQYQSLFKNWVNKYYQD